MPATGFYFWKKAPFTRLLFPLAGGIILQWYHAIDISCILAVSLCSMVAISCFFFVPFFTRYKLGLISGIVISVLFTTTGMWLVWNKDIRKDQQWFGNYIKKGDAMIATLGEPLVEKARSFKSTASLDYLLHGDSCVPVKGKIILYFKKDSIPLYLTYGKQIIFHKPLQEILNAGNPGGFDYKRYSFFQDITHQVYLKPGEFEILKSNKIEGLQLFIFNSRDWILRVLRTNITNEKERGLAEALLIGYKNDLDKELVQSYSNTGVVHVIAISGLHLGLIYGLLVWLCRPLQRRAKLKWLRPILIIAGLWLFSLLAGAQPSVLRSALMFSCIVLGESMDRKSSIFNTLALSAFILLCINPFWLWDAGFQLSYAAVLSIVIFMRPIYNWFYFKNKWIDMIWQLNAVTIAAQVLTLPFCIYHFHQFPNYFLFTNLIAVPLSSLILMIEITLCMLYFIPVLALVTGQLIGLLIRFMNNYVEWIEKIPFAVWHHLQISTIQAILLTMFLAFGSYWLLERSTRALINCLLTLLIFASLRSYSFIKSACQQKIIVYNTPQKTAIDIIDGYQYVFTGDSSLQHDDFARNFHFKPARTVFRLHAADSLDGLWRNENYISYRSRHFLIANGHITCVALPVKQTIDLLLIGRNARLKLTELTTAFTIKQVVIDGSAAEWKINTWKKDCDSLAIPFHNLSLKGAFVMNLR